MTSAPNLLEAARAAWLDMRSIRDSTHAPEIHEWATLRRFYAVTMDELEKAIAAEEARGEARHCKCCSGYDWDGSDCPGTPAEREPHYHGGEACHGEDCVGDAQKEEAP